MVDLGDVRRSQTTAKTHIYQGLESESRKRCSDLVATLGQCHDQKWTQQFLEVGCPKRETRGRIESYLLKVDEAIIAMRLLSAGVDVSFLPDSGAADRPSTVCESIVSRQRAKSAWCYSTADPCQAPPPEEDTTPLSRIICTPRGEERVTESSSDDFPRCPLPHPHVPIPHSCSSARGPTVMILELNTDNGVLDSRVGIAVNMLPQIQWHLRD